MRKTLGFYLHVLFILITAAGCRNAAQNSAQCAPTLSEDLKKLPQSGSVDDVHKMMHFYDSVPNNCHDVVVKDVIDNLFTVLYVHQPYDTIIIPFLNKISEEENISVQYKSRALLKIATFYLYGLEDIDRASPYLDKATKNLPQMNDSSKKGYYAILAQMNMQQSDLKAATNNYLKCIALCEKMKDSASYYSNMSNFSTVYSRMGDYNKAAEMKKKTSAYFLRKQDYANLIYGYIGVGTEYGLMRAYDSATRYYLLGIDLIENKGVQNPSMAFNLYLNLAGIKMGRSDYAEARKYYDKAKEQLQFMKDPHNERFFMMASAPAYASIQPMDSEINKIQGYIRNFMVDSDYNSASNANYTLFHIYYIQNKYEPALKSFITYDSLKSLISDQDNKKYVAEMETKYQTQKKQLQIEGQQKEIKKQRAINGLLAAIMVATILGIALLYSNAKLKRNRRDAELHREFTKKLLEKTEEERIRIARDLHDGVSQELMILKNQIDPSLSIHREKIDGIINEIRAISRDLHPVMLEKIGLKASVEHICEQMMENNYIFISSDITYTKTLNKAGELQMFRMIQEALNNIIKYAKAEAAKVTISESERYVAAEIMDNGKGFNVEEALNSKSSFGLMNLTERSKAMNGKTSITSSTAGTIIKIEIPKSDV